MKAIPFYGLFLIFLWASLFKSVAFVAFKVNQAEVVSSSCIEKDLEVNNCQGSCYLREKLGLNDSGQEQSERPALVEVQDLTFFS